MNSNVTDGQSPPQPTVDAGVESTAIATQVLETGPDEKHSVIEDAGHDGIASSKAKKVPQAGMKNYFVSRLPWMLFLANVRAASVLVWNNSRLLAHIHVLCYFNSVRRYLSFDERRLRYDLIAWNLMAPSASTDSTQVNWSARSPTTSSRERP